LQLLFAPDVSLRRLDGSVPEQKTNLFKFAVAIVAESGTGTTKIVWRQIRDASVSRTQPPSLASTASANSVTTRAVTAPL
jgi:hypothetical protein